MPDADAAARRIAADAGAAAPPRRRPRRGAAVGGAAPVRARPRARRAIGRAPTSPRKPARTQGAASDASTSSRYLDAVPEAVVERLRGARRVLAVEPREPRRRHARGDARRRPPRRGAGRHGRPRLHRPGPAAVRLPGRRRALPDRPGPGRAVRPARHLRLRLARADRRGRATATPSCSSGCRGSIIDHHASNDAAGDADWIDPAAAATCEMVALLAARLGRPARRGRRRAGRGADGRHRHGHGDLRPSRTRRRGRWRSSAALVEAGAPLSDISRRLYRTKPDAQLRLFGRVLDRLETSDDGRIVWSSADRRRPRRDRRPARPQSEGIIDLLVAGRGGRGRDPVQGGRRRRRGSASGPSPAASTRPC